MNKATRAAQSFESFSYCMAPYWNSWEEIWSKWLVLKRFHLMIGKNLMHQDSFSPLFHIILVGVPKGGKERRDP